MLRAVDRAVRRNRRASAKTDHGGDAYEDIPPGLEEARSYAAFGEYRVLPPSCGMLSDRLTSIACPRILKGVTTEGEIMAVQHIDFPTFGVQFHPESILTPDGRLECVSKCGEMQFRMDLTAFQDAFPQL